MSACAREQEPGGFNASQALVLPPVGVVASTSTHVAPAEGLNGVGTKGGKENIVGPRLQPPIFEGAQTEDRKDQNRIPGKFWREN